MTMHPPPDIMLEMPTRLSVRVSRAVREIKEAVAFIRTVYRKHRPSEADLKMYHRAIFDGQFGGETIIRDRDAYEQRRGPLFHSVRQA